jgi:hypothetical protein
VNLNLNDAGRDYVASLFKRDRARLLITHEAKLNELRPQIGRVYGAEQRLKDHFLKHVPAGVSGPRSIPSLVYSSRTSGPMIVGCAAVAR